MNVVRFGRALALVFLSSPLTVWAQNAPTAEEPTSMGALLVRTLVVLAFVVLSIYLVLNVGLRRLMGISGLGGSRGGVVRVVERTALEPKRSLYLVEAAGEYLLVGAAEGGLTLLAKLDSAEVQRLRSEKTGGPGGGTPFWERLKARQGGTPPPTA